MSRKKKWPTDVKVVIGLLVVAIIAIALVKQPKTNTVTVFDSPRRSSTGSGDRSPTTRAPATHGPSTSTAAPTTVPAPATAVPPTAPSTPAPTPPPAPAQQTAAGQASAALGQLPVVALDQTHPYDRVGDFGQAWTDDNNDLWGHNGCDTRNDILKRDLQNVVFRPGTHDCVVISGTFVEPYSGQPTTFAKAQASKVQIDHLVPLHAAWQLGAWQWSQEKRIDYANDPTVLLAVSGSLNASKGDDLANEWLPPNAGYHCTYAIKTVDVHAKYGLPVTAGEKSTLAGILARC